MRNRPLIPKSLRFNRLGRISLIAVVLGAGVAVSAQAESRSREETVERAIGVAVGAVLNGGLENPEAAARSVAIGELERILRERSRARGRTAPRNPDRDRRSTPAPRSPRGYGSELVMPVVGVEWHEMNDSYGAPRSGGRRHQGVDIFAPRWTEIVAVTYGVIDSIGNGGLGGRTIWLRGEDGRSYYYAHLEDWARGLRRGMRVGPGQLIGYVGNSGNARTTPTHLHFEVRDGGRSTNPYYVLADATPTRRATDRVALADNRSIWDQIVGWW